MSDLKTVIYFAIFIVWENEMDTAAAHVGDGLSSCFCDEQPLVVT